MSCSCRIPPSSRDQQTPPFLWGGWRRVYSGVPFPSYYFDRSGVHPHAAPPRALADALDARVGPAGGEHLLRVAQFQQPQHLAEQLGVVVCGLLPAALSDWLVEQGGVASIGRLGAFSQTLSGEVALDAAAAAAVRQRIVGALGWFMAREVAQDTEAIPSVELEAECARLYDRLDPLLRLFEVPVRFAPGPAPGGRLLRLLLEQGHVAMWPRPWAASLEV